ncbi:MAG: site-specific integrase [Candidatus Bathyarchaeia archaeon]|jgi:integrase
MFKGVRDKFEDEIERFLILKGKATGQVYASGYTKFLTFYQHKYGKDANFGHFFKRIYDDLKKPIDQQENLVDIELTDYINWLKQQKTRKKEPLSANVIRLYFASMQNLLKWKHIPISSSFIKVPAANGKKENGKHKWKIEQVKQFVDAASSYRDKAIALCIFQSGLGVNEICELNFGDVQDQLEAGVLPISLELIRKKTDVHFKSFFGRDAVKYLKMYLETRGKLSPVDPLFAKERDRGDGWRITPEIIEQSFSEIAKKLPFIKQQKDAYNAARPHSFRAGFNSRLINKVDENLREFWMGHVVPAVAKAYLEMPDEEMCELYMTAEQYLKIEKTSREEMTEAAKGKSFLSDVLESDVKAYKAKVESLEQRVKMHEEIFMKMTDMSFEEFAKWMQDSNRRLFAQQTEEDKKSTPFIDDKQSA